MTTADAEQVAATTPPEDPEPAPRRERIVSWLVIALVLLPFVVSALALLGSDGTRYHPYNDQAIIELQVRNVVDHVPLLGPYSRFDWFHPGPALYYVLAVPYWLTGATSGSLAFAALVVNAIAVLGVLLVARRRGGLAMLLVTSVVTGLLVHGLGAPFLRDVWNPYVTVLPLLLLAFLAWTASCGDRWAVPATAVVGSFLIQTHVGFALPVLVLAAGGVAGLVLTERAARGRGADPTGVRVTPPPGWWRSTALVTVVLLTLIWLPAVLQQLRDEPGNLGRLLRFFRDHGREQSYGAAWHVVGTQLGAWPDWVRGATDLNVIGAVDTTRATAFPVTLVALVGAAALAWRRWYGPALRLDLFALALVGATYVAATRIVGDVFPYIVRWTWAVGALAWIAIGWTLVSWLREPVRRSDPRVGRAVVGLGVAAVIVSSAVGVVDALDAGTPEPEASPRIARLTAAVEQELARHPGDGVVEIQMMDSPDSIFGGAGSIWTGAGIANLLDQRGYDVRVSPDLEFAYGPDWVVDPDEAVRLRVLPADTPEVGLVRDRGDYDQIARAGHTHVFVEPGAPR